MTTKAEYLAKLRIRLKDPDGKRWDDVELNEYLSAAAQDYSKYFPRTREQEFATDGSQRYDVPGDLLDTNVLRLTMTGENPLRPNQSTEIQARTFVRSSSHWFEVVDEKIVFGWIPPVATIVVRYQALHTMPDAGEASVPEEDEELILVCAGAMAWQRLSGNDAALSRWKEQGKRDDNPVIPEHREWWARYRRMVEQKKSAPRTGLRRVRAKGNWRW